MKWQSRSAAGLRLPVPGLLVTNTGVDNHGDRSAQSDVSLHPASNGALIYPRGDVVDAPGTGSFMDLRACDHDTSECFAPVVFSGSPPSGGADGSTRRGGQLAASAGSGAQQPLTPSRSGLRLTRDPGGVAHRAPSSKDVHGLVVRPSDTRIVPLVTL